MQIKSNVVLKIVNKKSNLFAISLDEKKNNLELFLPNNWWNSTSSLNYFSEESPQIFQLFKLEKRNKDFCNTKIDLPQSKDWNVKNGDYRVKETHYNKRDFLYYRELKDKIYKYSLYPVIALTILLTYYFSSILVRL